MNRDSPATRTQVVSSDGNANDAVGRLLVEHRQEFLAFLLRRVNPADAEEILQESIARGIARGTSLRDADAGLGWFYRVLRNAVIDHYRRRGARQRAHKALANEPVVDPPDPTMSPAIVCRCIEGLVPTLKPAYAAVIQRVDIEGTPVQRVAEEAGITTNNATVWLHRARAALRRQVVSTCGACATRGCRDCDCVPD